MSDEQVVSLSPAAFEHVAALVRRETAVRYEPGKEYLVEARLLPLARAHGHDDVDGYVAAIRTDLAETRRVIDALTINETSWFRDNAPYQAFSTTLLPDLMARRSATRRISIWSAASSSGQEAYSLAMLLHEQLPPDWQAEIWATDVSGAMVERVRRGRYSQVEMNRGLPATRLVRYFARVGSEWVVAPELRAMVQVRQLNLAAPLPPLPTFDLVMLRNVLIYFDLDVKREVLHRVRGQVATDGYLLLGATETTLDMEQHWRRESAGRVQVHRPLPTGEPTALPTAMAGA